MTKVQPIMISNIRGLIYLMIGFILALGILIFKVVEFDKMISNFVNSPIAFGFTMIFLIGSFFVLPVILLLYLKRIEIYDSVLVIYYPFRHKRKIFDFKEIDSFETHEGDARGISFTEICIKLKNNRKIKFNSLSNKNFKKCISTLSKKIKNK